VPTSVRAAIKAPFRPQRGFSLLFLVVGLLLAAVTVFAVTLINRTSRGAGQAEVTKNNMATVRDALVAYVTLNGRLPCPAKPSALDGKADPETPIQNCNTPAGVVPWATLGLPADVAEDGWNRLISYRALDGARGLTQTGGASMVDCDIGLPFGPEDLPTNGLCQANHLNLEKQYLANKGLIVNDLANLVNGVAFVLVGHGESGLGAYGTSGTRMPLPASAAESANTGAVGPFQQLAHSAPGTEPSANNHFDDTLVWMRLEDLIRKSGLAGRDWQQEGAKISAATMTNMNTSGPGHFNATTATTGETFAAASSNSGGVAVPTLSFGAGPTDQFTNCSWWPTPFRIVSAEGGYTLRMYIEFAVADIGRAGPQANDFGGFVVGFLPSVNAAAVPTQISTSLCGNTDEVNARDIGWENGALGNLPSPRFGIEYDPRSNPAYSDPPLNHLALDLDGTRHGTNAPLCSIVANTYDYISNPDQPACYTGDSTAWLRNGLASFHHLRIEVAARSSDCSNGPKMTTWVIPESVCPDGNSDPLCVSVRSLTSEFKPDSPPAAVVKLSRCISTPTPPDLLDRLYFGITASNGRSDGNPALYLRNLAAGVF
jgi:hypothetical protein